MVAKTKRRNASTETHTNRLILTKAFVFNLRVCDHHELFSGSPRAAKLTLFPAEPRSIFAQRLIYPAANYKFSTRKEVTHSRESERASSAIVSPPLTSRSLHSAYDFDSVDLVSVFLCTDIATLCQQTL